MQRKSCLAKLRNSFEAPLFFDVRIISVVDLGINSVFSVRRINGSEKVMVYIELRRKQKHRRKQKRKMGYRFGCSRV